MRKFGPASRRPHLRANNVQLALAALPVALASATWVPLWFFAMALAHALGIPDHAPVRDQPNGLLWLVLFLAAMPSFMVVGASLGVVLNVVIVRSYLGWSWIALRESGAFPLALVDWLERRAASRVKNTGRAPVEDPMHDPELDDVATVRLR